MFGASPSLSSPSCCRQCILGFHLQSHSSSWGRIWQCLSQIGLESIVWGGGLQFDTQAQMPCHLCFHAGICCKAMPRCKHAVAWLQMVRMLETLTHWTLRLGPEMMQHRQNKVCMLFILALGSGPGPGLGPLPWQWAPGPRALAMVGQWSHVSMSWFVMWATRTCARYVIDGPDLHVFASACV